MDGFHLKYFICLTFFGKEGRKWGREEERGGEVPKSQSIICHSNNTIPLSYCPQIGAVGPLGMKIFG